MVAQLRLEAEEEYNLVENQCQRESGCWGLS